MKIMKMPNGRVNVRATIMTLEPGQSLKFREADTNLEYCRVVCCKIARNVGWDITVSSPADAKGMITITRNS